MGTRLAASCVLAAIIGPTSGVLAAASQQQTAGSGSIGIRLVDVPGEARDNPLARTYIVDRLAPGTTIRRRVEISNTTQVPADVAVYPAAAGVRRGAFWFAPPGHGGNELSRWTSVGRDVLRIPPGGTAFDKVTIKVPLQATSGERYAVIWAEVSAPEPITGSVTLVNRVGLRMYVSVGPGGAPPSNFVIGSLTGERSASGEPAIVAEVRNSGRRTLEISGSLTLDKGPGGLQAGPVPVRLATALAPGASEFVTVPLDRRLPRGPWQALLQLRSGDIQRTSAATITFPLPVAAAKPERVSAAPSVLRYLVAIVALLGAMLITAVALLLSRTVSVTRRR